MNLRGNNGGGKQWSDSGYILKAESKGFANGLAMWCERKRVKDDPKSFDLNKWVTGIVINGDGDACKGSGFVGNSMKI